MESIIIPVHVLGKREIFGEGAVYKENNILLGDFNEIMWEIDKFMLITLLPSRGKANVHLDAFNVTCTVYLSSIVICK